MTEPTAEQIEEQRERAHAVLDLLHMWCEPTVDDAPHDLDCTLIATALARVRIEAHAAGRDDGLKLAEALCHSQDCGQECGHCSCAYDLSERIRALRGRT